MSLQVKRTIVGVVSAAIGTAATWAVIYLSIPLGPVTFGFGTTAEKFAYSNVLFLFISVGCIVGIWLDYFLDAQILKS
jgi:hypothetical protein